MRLELLRAVLAIAAFSAAGCDIFPGAEARGGGGGFEGETVTLAGQILYPGGQPAVGARIRLRSEGYGDGDAGLPGWDMATGPDGRYAISGVPEGAYVLESFDTLDHSSSLPLSVASPVKPKITLEVPPDTLRPVGAMAGRVVIAAGDSSAMPAGQVRIIGLERFAPLGADGSFLVGDLPPGRWDVQVLIPVSGGRVRMNGVQVSSGDTARLADLPYSDPAREDYSTWPHSRRIHLNTLASGAGVAEPTLDFPLLVRLDSARFDFAQAAHPADGADIRFSKADGTPLPFEKDHWDAGQRIASFWVRMDTVYGNRSDQYLVMHWGKAGVFGFSRPQAVFDSSAGFAGVWHFIKDRQAVDATGRNMLATDQGTQFRPGMVGQSRRFDGWDVMSVPDSPVLRPPAFTLSCWAYREGNQVASAKLFFKGRRTWPFASYTLDMRRAAGGPTFKVSQADTSERIAQSPADLPDSAWVHLAATFDPATGAGRLYVDGVQSAGFDNAGPIGYYTTDHPLLIGNESADGAPNRPFKGRIDEARLESVARSKARVKLEYENQRSDGKLVEFR